MHYDGGAVELLIGGWALHEAPDDGVDAGQALSISDGQGTADASSGSTRCVCCRIACTIILL
jgi:hypothetical protein